MKPRVFLILALGLVLLAPACSGNAGAETAGQTISAATSYRAIVYRPGDRRLPKAWRGSNLHGAPIRSSDFRGAITVVNFWASWCGPCRAEQDDLQRLWVSYQPKGARFLGVNIREKTASALAYVDEFGVTYPSVHNEDSTIAHKFRVSFIPTTFVLDRSGRIAAKVIGPTREEDLRRILDEALAA